MKRYSGNGAALLASVLAVVALSACHSRPQNVPGDSEDHRPWHGITEGEQVHFTGTEPFWGGKVSGTELTYTTPENPGGETVEVSRFAGRGGLSFSGTLTGQAATLAVAPGQCSDGMSDRSYPFTVTLRIGPEVRQGCGWTDRQGYTGGEQAP